MPSQKRYVAIELGTNLGRWLREELLSKIGQIVWFYTGRSESQIVKHRLEQHLSWDLSRAQKGQCLRRDEPNMSRL